jgi:predicted GNAT family N-acyltransferase
MTVRIAAGDAELAACLRIRRTVFIGEMGVPEAHELDELDPVCTHFLAWLESSADHRSPDTAIGTARLWVTNEGRAKAQRVAVLQQGRGAGIGRILMRAVEECARDAGHHELILGAQKTAIRFYLSIGYQAYGPEFIDAGIPHRMMRRSL